MHPTFMKDTAIPWPAFDAEVAFVRRLVQRVPWQRPDGSEDRALRAEYRRWTSADAEPTPLMLAPLWAHAAVAQGWHSLDEAGLDRAVHHAALVLHLVALGEGASGAPLDNLGAAAHRAGVAEGRFARLVNTPAPARLETLGRLFRRLARENVSYRATAPPAEEGQPDRRSSRATLRDGRRDDLAALLAFLFTDEPRPAASRWAAGYYRTTDAASTSEAADATQAT